MQLIYNWIGRLMFPRRQVWEQRQSAKTLMLTVAFALTLGLVLATVIRMMYNHRN